MMVLETQRKTKKANILRMLTTVSESLHWSRDKHVLIQKLHRANSILVLVGCVGTCLSIVVNEMVIMGYGSVLTLDFCKTVNSFCSVACVLLLGYIYWKTHLLRAVSFSFILASPLDTP